MTTEQFNALVRQDIDRVLRPRPNGFHWVFEYDPEAGYSADRINYGPFNCSSCSWIVPGTIEEEITDEL